MEIVGLYEAQREALERDDAALRADVRQLSAQLRDAQNAVQAATRRPPAAAARCVM